MSYFSFAEYKLKGFERSDSKHKKYNAILTNKSTKKEKRIPFGDSRYEQYHDSTGLGLYSSKNHEDKTRRGLYRQRHKKDLRDGYFSAGYFAYHYLW
jgi:hypothetical protein